MNMTCIYAFIDVSPTGLPPLGVRGCRRRRLRGLDSIPVRGAWYEPPVLSTTIISFSCGRKRRLCSERVWRAKIEQSTRSGFEEIFLIGDSEPQPYRLRF